jgi:TonB family protein
MNRRAIFLILCPLALLLTTHRLPAPISEVEEKATPLPQESVKPKKHSKPKEEEDSKKSEAKSTPRPSGKAKNLDGPKPVYPAGAAGHLTGTGKYTLQFDQTTGKVIDVIVTESCGSPVLDNAAVAAFRQWHEDPQCAKEVVMTMTFGTAQQTAE